MRVPLTTESGERLGRVRHLRAERRPRSVHVTDLVLRRAGLLGRLGIGAPQSTLRLRTKDAIPWSTVVRVDRRGPVVRDGTRPSAR